MHIRIPLGRYNVTDSLAACCCMSPEFSDEGETLTGMTSGTIDSMGCCASPYFMH
ncbi:hypothetical protein ACZ87_00629 [Candidatus Erwinia dacicola]|uniref:Uncharacterized protein n=1 Tax=Candidatus Erwinia dacicola TaxID=252393 RepID=A0A328TPN0_9GAMM|nr:hypothetical protein ACZ87_00629 [Candidatus Erwinia dacicola]